jgi:hypothetical protein
MKKIKQLIKNMIFLCNVDIEDKLKNPVVHLEDIRKAQRRIQNHGNKL